MSNVSLAQQIAELTPEQKNSMGEIYKKYIISIVSVFVICILIGIGMFVESSIRAENAKDNYDRLDTEIASNAVTHTYDLSLYDERSEAMDAYYDAKQDKSFALVIGATAGILGVLIVALVFKKKYPYFSEKKYNYMKKNSL